MLHAERLLACQLDTQTGTWIHYIHAASLATKTKDKQTQITTHGWSATSFSTHVDITPMFLMPGIWFTSIQLLYANYS